MTYLFIKWLHIVSATLLVGTGLGTAFYLFMAHRSRDTRAIAVTAQSVVLADWWFTTPTIIIQPISGFLLLNMIGVDWREGWVLASIGLYVFAGLLWIPVVWIQIQLRDIATSNLEVLPEQYWKLARIWTISGFPAFIAMGIIYLLMVFKPVW